MKKEQGLFLAAAIVETIYAIPLVGGTIIISLLWIPLILALALHIVALVFAMSAKPQQQLAGSIIGIIANVLGFIPFLGWVLHLVSAIVNYIQAFNPVKK